MGQRVAIENQASAEKGLAHLSAHGLAEKGAVFALAEHLFGVQGGDDIRVEQA